MEFAGNKEIELCGVKYGLQPDFEALSSIELLGRPIIDMLVAFSNGGYQYTDVVVIIYCCMRSYAGKEFKLSRYDVGELVRAEGLSNVSEIACEMISNILSGDEEEKKRVAKKILEKTQ